MSLLDLIDKFQTLIAGVFGFGAVIITVRSTAALERQRHRTQVSHDATTLRLALIEELKINRKAFKGNFNAIDNPYEGGSFLVPSSTITLAYSSNVQKIGLLHQSQIGPVISAYSVLMETAQSLLILAHDGDIPNGPIPLFVKVPSSNAKILRSMNESVVRQIDTALEALGSQSV